MKGYATPEVVRKILKHGSDSITASKVMVEVVEVLDTGAVLSFCIADEHGVPLCYFEKKVLSLHELATVIDFGKAVSLDLEGSLND